jgi:predicted outer membrane repeat protein
MRGYGRVIAAILGAGLIGLASAAPVAALPSPDCSAADSAELTAKLATISCLTINLAPGSYATAATPAFQPNHNVTIHGAGAATTSLTRTTGAGDIFNTGAFAVGLDNLTVRDAAGGAGVALPATTSQATLDHVVIDNNAASGVVSSSNVTTGTGALAVTDTVISNNVGTEGGGVYALGTGTMSFDRVLFEHNKSADTTGGGGGFDLETAAHASFINVTFANNRANNNGGAIRQNSTLSTIDLNNVTISGNVADDDNAGGANAGDGGGISKSFGTLQLKNTVLAGNVDNGTTVTAPDCDANSGFDLVNLGNTFVGDPTDCSLTAPPATGDPRLAPLADNGGPTMTMALQPGSPLLDSGNPGTPDGSGARCASVDQRGQPRGGAAGPCDIGAFEAQPPPPTTTPPSPTPTTPTTPRKKCKKKRKAAAVTAKKCKKKRK